MYFLLAPSPPVFLPPPSLPVSFFTTSFRPLEFLGCVPSHIAGDGKPRWHWRLVGGTLAWDNTFCPVILRDTSTITMACVVDASSSSSQGLAILGYKFLEAPNHVRVITLVIDCLQSRPWRLTRNQLLGTNLVEQSTVPWMPGSDSISLASVGRKQRCGNVGGISASQTQKDHEPALYTDPSIIVETECHHLATLHHLLPTSVQITVSIQPPMRAFRYSETTSILSVTNKTWTYFTWTSLPFLASQTSLLKLDNLGEFPCPSGNMADVRLSPASRLSEGGPFTDRRNWTPNLAVYQKSD
ncbi:hypothetical protein BKA70DRAFT_1218181 [Coprinopsis sp. MPI-PUGE-AT-0042]|nr:hypothetical protein BKA70DRAFT_1218181 [Coprinopsis sp. MPI-PUGE-AT-0042]